MKKLKRTVHLGVLLVVMTLLCGFTVQAKEADTVKNGISVESIDLSGMTEQKATAAIEAYVE